MVGGLGQYQLAHELFSDMTSNYGIHTSIELASERDLYILYLA